MESKASEAFLAIGKIIRSHGLSGEMVVAPEVGHPVFLEQIALFYCKNDRYDLIPLRVEHSKVIEKNKKSTFFVKFEKITDKNGVDALKNRILYVKREDFIFTDERDDQFEVYNCIDFELISEDNEHYGVILDIMDNPAHPILEIMGPHGHLMVPYVEEYIVRIDKHHHRVIGRNISQLLNI